RVRADRVDRVDGEASGRTGSETRRVYQFGFFRGRALCGQRVAFARGVRAGTERDVNDPVTNKPLLGASSNREFRIGALGSGSDYTPFLQHLGVASLDMRFGSEDAGVYHSDYDDYAWYSRFSDTTFAHGKALAQVETTALLRLADSEIVPFEFGRFVMTVRRYTDEVASLGSAGQKPDLAAVRAALARLQKSAADLDAAYLRMAPALGSAPPEKVAALNRILYRTE